MTKERNITRAGIVVATDFIASNKVYASHHLTADAELPIDKFTNIYRVLTTASSTFSFPPKGQGLRSAGQTGILEFYNDVGGDITDITWTGLDSDIFFPYEDETKAARITPALPLADGTRFILPYFIGANENVYFADYQTFE